MRSGTQARVKNWDADTGILSISNVGIGTTSPSSLLHLLKDDATNNDVTDLLTLTHTTSGTPATSVGFNPDTGSSLTTNLISYWKLDETSGTRVDSVGNNDLTDNNTVLYGAGKQGNGADLEIGRAHV